VEPGNDPGRDEYGLPPVDIEIPDDARDLDRDVQAYYRELRARRRHLRFRRLTGPLTRHGMVLPLVAACLALTLLTGSLLTVLSGHQIPVLRNRVSAGTTHGVSASGGQLLPDASVYVQRRHVLLRALAPAVLAWVPAGCASCGRVLRQLASQANQKHVAFYFVGHDQAQTTPELVNLAKVAGPYSQDVVNDTTNALGMTYRLGSVTAIFAHNGGSVQGPDVVRGLFSSSAKQKFETRLKILASANAAAGSAGPARPTPQAS
jgi:hypothetical protein